MKANFVLILMAALSLVSCGKKNNTGDYLSGAFPPPPPSSEKTEQLKVAPLEVKTEDIILRVSRLVELKDDLSNQSDFVQNLNHHQVVAEMPEGARAGYFLRCKDSNKDTNPVHVPFFSKIASLELIYKGEQLRHDYQCEVLDPEGKVIFEHPFAIKKDLLIEKRLTISESIDVGALVFYDHSTLVTNGSNLTMKADVFLGGMRSSIETFSESELSSLPDLPGKNGGEINIETKRSLGELTVNLRGKNAGVLTTVENSYSEFKVPQTCTHGTYDLAINFPRKGQAGLPGGNSGSFNLKAQKHHMSLFIHKFPGQGGLGQVSLNPAAELKLQYTSDDDALGIVRAPKLRDIISPQWNEDHYNAYGTVCFVQTIGAHGKYSRFKYTVFNVTKLPPLNQETAVQTQRGVPGPTGKEDQSCIIEESTKTKECL